jgi:gamma-glutamyltranspeptidase/glutathione hydrolase
MQTLGGLIRRADLAKYEAKERTVIRGTYRGCEIIGAPPPSSGGITLILALNMLENFEIAKKPRQSAETIHLLSEVQRRAFLDRARHLGDPDFAKIPPHLINKDYAKNLAAGIDLAKATKSETLAPELNVAEGTSTTHFSIIDKDGMAVSQTYTLENAWGNRVVVRGAGFLLNNQMTDFNTHPGLTTKKGGIGTEPNTIAPGKRMLSSMCPIFVAKDGKLLLVTGSPGGRTIISTVMCVTVNVIDYGMDVQTAVNEPRSHHQWFPDRISLERLKQRPDLVTQLKAMGHEVATARQGDAHTIWIDPKTGTYSGAADVRLNGKATGY